MAAVSTQRTHAPADDDLGGRHLLVQLVHRLVVHDVNSRVTELVALQVRAHVWREEASRDSQLCTSTASCWQADTPAS